jgi:transposase
MLDKEIRSAILLLHEKGHSQREIADDLDVSRESVRQVLKSRSAEVPERSGASRLDVYLEDIRFLHKDCQGNRVRVAERLKEEKGVEVPYPSLTRFCRRHGIGVKPPKAARAIITAPGEEMQHDTSPYTIEIGGKRVRRHGASLVLGHSRLLYLQFYPRFDRFHCKAFLTKAFQYVGGVCRRCVIDNTSVVVAAGTGENAVMASEMEAFERRFGFHFLAHELGHADRSGKVERPFYYVERNFLAGRRFKDDADLNAQALQWMEKTANPRRLREFNATPLERFAQEKPHLVALPLYIPEAYQIHRRTVDAYSCVTLDEAKYPVPPAYVGRDVLVRETLEKIVVVDGHRDIAVHPRKMKGAPEIKTAPTTPPPRRARQAHLVEEPRLLVLGGSMPSYLEALKKERGARYVWSLRKLFHLLCQYRAEDLLRAVEVALGHRVFDVRRVETILLQNLAERDFHLPLGFEDQADAS